MSALGVLIAARDLLAWGGLLVGLAVLPVALRLPFGPRRRVAVTTAVVAVGCGLLAIVFPGAQ